MCRFLRTRCSPADHEVLARFEAERQALALMDHPNIARVLDAGLGPGDRPYFVMEYVAGVPTATPVAATLPKGDVLAVSGRSVFIARESRIEEWDRVTFARSASHALSGEALAADSKGRRVLVRLTAEKPPSYAVVDIATGETLSRPVLGNEGYPRFTPDGAHFVTRRGSNEGGVTWWDAETGRALANRVATTAATVLGFTPDSRQVLLGTPSSVSLWTPESGREAVVVTLGKGVSAGAAAVTPDGARIITAGSDGLLKEWDVRTRAEIRTYGRQPQSNNMAVSPDGRLVAVESWATISIWDCATGTTIVELKDGTDLGLQNLLFSPDGSQVFARSRYRDVRVWDVRKARLAAGSVGSVAFSRDGVRIAAVLGEPRTGFQLSGFPRRLRAWDISAGRQLIDVAVDLAEVAFDGTGRRVLVVGAGIQTLERRRHEGMARLTGPTCNSDTHDTLQVWDLESRQKTMGAQKQCAYAAAFTPDGASVVSDSWETPIVLHAVDSGGITMRSEELPPILSLAVSPDGSRVAIATGESQVVVLDARTFETLLAIRVESRTTDRVVFSADGTRLVTTADADHGSESHIVHVYDTRPPREPEVSPEIGRR